MEDGESRVHPMTLKAELREALTLDRVLTTVQLERRGWDRAAQWLEYPQVMGTVKIGSTQVRSAQTLQFVCRDDRVAALPHDELFHYAGLAECRSRFDHAAWGEWRHVDERRAGEKPDVEILAPHQQHGLDRAVEFDAGYSMDKVQRKLRAYGEGYAQVVWAVSRQGRVRNVHRVVAELGAKQLGSIQEVRVLFVDASTVTTPYQQSRRNHKPLSLDWYRTRPAW